MVALGAKWVLRVRWAGRSYYSRLLSEFDFLAATRPSRGSGRGGCGGERDMSATLRDLRTPSMASYPGGLRPQAACELVDGAEGSPLAALGVTG